jgi:AcrR family transcriptional regulator
VSGRIRRSREQAREQILDAAVRRIAQEGIDSVSIARIARDAGVSSSLVHYHFDSRESLLAQAVEHSYERAGAVRVNTGETDARATHAERLAAMVDQCLPTTPGLHEDWVLWVELWLRAVRHPELGPIAQELYARMHAWFAAEIDAGVSAGEFARCDADEVADRALALLDGFGIRTLIGDSAIPLERARQTVRSSLARDLGLGERLTFADGQAGEATPSASRAAARPVSTAPSM